MLQNFVEEFDMKCSVIPRMWLVVHVSTLLRSRSVSAGCWCPVLWLSNTICSSPAPGLDCFPCSQKPAIHSPFCSRQCPCLSSSLGFPALHLYLDNNPYLREGTTGVSSVEAGPVRAENTEAATVF